MHVNFRNIIAGTQLLGQIAKHGKDLACYMKKGFVCAAKVSGLGEWRWSTSGVSDLWGFHLHPPRWLWDPSGQVPRPQGLGRHWGSLSIC